MNSASVPASHLSPFYFNYGFHTNRLNAVSRTVKPPRRTVAPLERNTSPSVPVNPNFLPYDGSTDPSLWLLPVKAALKAFHTPADQHLRWLVHALRGQAMRYCFFKVEPHGPVTSTAQFIQPLVQRFRTFSQSYHLQQQHNVLRMQPGGYLSYSDRFLEIATPSIL